MNGQTIAILESRAGESLADLVRTRGGRPFSAPALAEVPDVDREALAGQIHAWESAPPALFVFQTGVGTRALFEAADAMSLMPSLLQTLDAACVVVRGPKPSAALRSRSVRIDRAARDPFTTAEVLAAVADVPLAGRHAVVQRYGDANPQLTQALQARGATVSEVVTYRWSLPPDVGPLHALIAALRDGEIDVAVFTSASQVHNLFAVAGDGAPGEALRASLCRTRVASIGPVCSAALREAGVQVDVEARPPKLGPLMAAVEQLLAPRSPT